MPPSKTALDFGLWPQLQSRKMFLSLDTGIETAMQALPETWARADAALKFCWFTSAGADQLHAKEPHATRLREAFLRACLTEYRAMDEVLPRDLAALPPPRPQLAFNQIRNPVVHLMKELRNLEIHLTSSRLTPATKQVFVNRPNGPFEHDATIWCIDPLTDASFKTLRNARYYSDADITRMVTWFNQAQQEWGIDHLAFLAIEAYCGEL